MDTADKQSTSWSDFSDWTQGRTIQALGTNLGAPELPFQGWRRFKEAFAPEIVELAIRETSDSLGRKLNGLIDPFGGSGTSAIASQFLGVHPTTIEVNPFLADLIEAKIAHYPLEKVGSLLHSVINDVQRQPAQSTLFPGAPKTFVEPGVEGQFIFPRNVAQRFVAYRNAIARIDDAAIRRLFRVILGSTAVPVSNVVVSGKGRRYRKGWENRQQDPSQVDHLFKSGILSAIHDLQRFQHRKCRDYTILRGDARSLIKASEKIDIAVFSPPYPNSFDYTDVYNIELWTLGYLADATTNRTLRESTIRSHVQIRRDMSAGPSNSATLKNAVQKLVDARSRLWNGNIPEMVDAYFDDMRLVLRALHNRLQPGGRVYMTIGDSRYATVSIPVATILAEEAPTLSYDVIRAEPMRSMRASPQQGGRQELAETLIVLRARA